MPRSYTSQNRVLVCHGCDMDIAAVSSRIGYGSDVRTVAALVGLLVVAASACGGSSKDDEFELRIYDPTGEGAYGDHDRRDRSAQRRTRAAREPARNGLRRLHRRWCVEVLSAHPLPRPSGSNSSQAAVVRRRNQRSRAKPTHDRPRSDPGRDLRSAGNPDRRLTTRGSARARREDPRSGLANSVVMLRSSRCDLPSSVFAAC